MTDAERADRFVVVSRFERGFYFSPPDFSDPKSRSERETDDAKVADYRRQRNAQAARYRQRIAQKRHAA